MGSSASKKRRSSMVAVSAVNAFNQAGKRHNEKNDANECNQDAGRPPTTVTIDAATNPPGENGTFPSALKKRPSEKDAAVMIQRVYRGHQERQQRKKENEMAIVIQRRYRRHISTSEDKNQTKEADKTKVLEDRREKRKDRDRAWRDKTVATKKNNDAQISEQVQQELHGFQDEIVQLKWQADQQVEQNFMIGTAPPRVVFISSKIGKSELLADAAHDQPNIMVIPYNFERDTFEELIDNMRSKLNAYKHGCRAQSVCFYCQGGPGFLYIVKGKVLTVVKIKKPSEKDQRKFWVSIGDMMSKVDPETTVIHVMGCHVLGKENGQELFDHISTMMKPNIVQLKSPLELSEEGKATIDLYFDNEKYKEWKLQRYTKTDSLINKYKES
ncbi:NMDA receptor synaptonuclear signaling and neuronal migration factor-like [Anneissia japonica]|uniref:NMDA receptor synaptonuclear signaling and neuronal migration factor-like n=1 Tax=Anneissia japonica TaxID=1529436 RepID=UPI0014255C9B|nr:NMDA receptor synaptonuclear signaling and neuronal migration factor-like [Anneissia japonica]